MTFWHRHLRDTVTVWQPEADLRSFGAPLLGLARWGSDRRRVADEDQRRTATRDVVLTLEPTPGAIIAPGDRTATSPWENADAHEVVRLRSTARLSAPAELLHRATVRPVRGLMTETVDIFEVQHAAAGRSYTLTRAATAAYSGPAAVVRAGATTAGEREDGSWRDRWPVMVMVPGGAVDLAALAQVEIDWNGLTLHGRPAWDTRWSPFWIGFGCELRTRGAPAAL